jgi:glutamate N-acetyltransferase/amino-acid N-acetyltransferase
MAAEIEFLSQGTVTSPEGFFAGATSAGINKRAADKLDLAVLFSEAPCLAAAVFTTSKLKSAPVLLSQQRLKSRERIGALVVNSGCANAYVGAEGLANAIEMAEMVGEGVGVPAEDVLVASTGVIGVPLPMEKIRINVEDIILARDGGNQLARAIMTTDSFPKEAAVRVKDGKNEFTIGGAVKGSGMIHPELATLLGFITTDAAVEKGFLQKALKKAVDASFNMISVDGDASPNDMVLAMANGLAGEVSPDAFEEALEKLCIHLAKTIASDGEGATKLIEMTVSGAADLSQARKAARAVISSSLVKTAVYGADPNWGRIMAAVGRSGVEVKESKFDLAIGKVQLVKAGKPLSFDKSAVIKLLKDKEVRFSVSLNLGSGEATAWGCDLSPEYVTINSQYMT